MCHVELTGHLYRVQWELAHVVVCTVFSLIIVRQAVSSHASHAHKGHLAVLWQAIKQKTKPKICVGRPICSFETDLPLKGLPSFVALSMLLLLLGILFFFLCDEHHISPGLIVCSQNVGVSVHGESSGCFLAVAVASAQSFVDVSSPETECCGETSPQSTPA